VAFGCPASAQAIPNPYKNRTAAPAGISSRPGPEDFHDGDYFVKEILEKRARIILVGSAFR